MLLGTCVMKKCSHPNVEIVFYQVNGKNLLPPTGAKSLLYNN